VYRLTYGHTNEAKSLLEGTIEAIMWAKRGSPSIPLRRSDVHITHPEPCD
jgi:hypothetical protein